MALNESQVVLLLRYNNDAENQNYLKFLLVFTKIDFNFKKINTIIKIKYCGYKIAHNDLEENIHSYMLRCYQMLGFTVQRYKTT